VALGLIGGENAGATATGTVSFYCGIPLNSLGSTSGDLPLSATASGSQACSGSGTVVPGAISLWAHQHWTQNGSNATGTMEFTDIVFSASGGAPGTASVAVTVHLEGLVTNSSFSSGIAWSNNLSVGHKKTSDPGASCCLPGVFDYLLASGGAVGPFSADYTSPAFLVELNTPWTLLIGNRSGTGAYDTQISSVLGFEIGEEVFVLPEGITANSIDGQIVDNIFVGVAIPEPATAVLLACAVGALALGRRARGRSAASQA
jgi:hypothetical protein